MNNVFAAGGPRILRASPDTMESSSRHQGLAHTSTSPALEGLVGAWGRALDSRAVAVTPQVVVGNNSSRGPVEKRAKSAATTASATAEESTGSETVNLFSRAEGEGGENLHNHPLVASTSTTSSGRGG
ncbi:unnamed protein product, partial [Amoebophrya sp. A25]|eukprot:GSA25T00020603001.1